MKWLVSSRSTPTSGVRSSARIRSKARTNSSAVSARIMPRLAESASGLSTQGDGSPTASAASRRRGSASTGKREKPGTLSPACRRRSRERYLSRQASAASGGWDNRPSKRPARAAQGVGRSPIQTSAATGLVRAYSAMLCAPASGSSKRSGKAPSCHGSSKTWQRSVAKTTASPSFSAASTKACVWYPVVVHKSRRRCLVVVSVMVGEICSHDSKPDNCPQIALSTKEAGREVSRNQLPVHYVVGEILVWHMSPKPVSGQVTSECCSEH